jgi:hypothetical protein
MRARIYEQDKMTMKMLGGPVGKSMSAFAREALSRLLSGEDAYKPPQKPHITNATFVIPHDMEEGVKALAHELKVPLDVVVREAVHRAMQALRDQTNRQKDLQTCEAALLAGQESEQDP